MTSLIEQTPRQLRLSVEISLRYHNRRRAFFESLHKIVVFIGLLGGSAAFFVIWNELGAEDGALRNFGMYGALSIAALHALDLVIGFAPMASLHQSLYQRFTALAAEMDGFEGDEDQELRVWQARKGMIDHDEPAPFHALYAICRNEVFQTTGGETDKKYIRAIPWYRRWTAHIWKHADFVPA